MKKSLIALAVLAASGAAMAQSSVTLYGVVDLWLGSQKGTGITVAPGGTSGALFTYGGPNPSSVTKMGSGGLSSGRWGLKGEEDLGGGLKATFQIESGFAADTGVGNGGPNRQTALGLTGGFGTLTFGNIYTAMDDVLGAPNSALDSAFSPSNNVLAVNTYYNGAPKNAIKYVSPNMSGFSFGVSTGLKEATNTAVNDVSLSYASGPLAANFAYQVQTNIGGAGVDGKLTALNATYDLGMAKLLAGVGQAKLGNMRANDVQFGVDVPLSSALTVSAGFAQSKDNAAAGNVKRTGFGLAAGYNMSKRTTAYAGVNSSQAKVSGTKIDKTSLVAVGIRHKF